MAAVLEILLAAVAGASLTVAAIATWTSRGRSRVADTLRSVGISAEDLSVPDVLILEDRPLRVAVGLRHLYIRPFTIAEMDGFARNYLLFLKRVEGSHELQTYLEDDEQLVEAKSSWAITFFSQAHVRAAAADMIRVTLLHSKRCNPEKVTAKYFAKNVTPDGLAQICWAIYQYNAGGCVKKKLSYHLRSILSGGSTDTSQYPSRRKTEEARANTSGLLFPDSPFVPAEVRSSLGLNKTSSTDATLASVAEI